ncbi:MAG: retron Eco8 family effector endonuclease [Sulfurovum sp.]|nr:retron Eco8 family effector endonuclease [Sulfurovum sp.]
MSIKSIKIKNLLSFDELIIDDFKDINCIVGRNNSGKSNLLKLIRFFYNKLEGKRELPPTLNSNYSTFGTITIVYDTSRIKQIVTSETNKGKSSFFKHIYNVLFKEYDIFSSLDKDKNSIYELTLQVNSDDSTKWSTKNKDILNIINYLYPFFDIETRHIDLYDWNKLWIIVSRLKSFNINKLKQDDIVKFFNNKLSSDGSGYKEYIEKIQHATQTNKYSYREKVLNYVKAGLKGQTFLIDEKSLEVQSDGTNSYRFIKIALELLISLTRRDYINPTIYIDEPEVGLHPKRNEELIYKLYDIYNTYKKTKETKEKGKYKTPYPNIIFATHSPNIVKEVIKLFEANQQILHFSKKQEDNTRVQKMKSTYEDSRFLNIFSDNEARLFFSNFILFVEGETELEIFGNKKLLEKFPKLKEIDIYKSSSNVLSSHINPAYSNTAIPYLFLFDADKIYSFNSKIRKFTFENKNKNLYRLPDGKLENNQEIDKLISKYKKGFNKKYKNKLDNILKLKTIQDKEFTFDKFSFKIKETEEFKKTIQITKNYLNDYNIKFLHTTIEEVLISSYSKKLFFKWVKKKYKIKQTDFTRKKRKKRKFLTEDILIEYFRLLFGGKMEILVPYKQIIDVKNTNQSKKLLTYQSKKLLTYLEKKLPKQDKTSGWATDFLNFAIDEMDNSLTATDKKKREEEFRKKFKQNFGELYDIITSIETKLPSDR